MSERVKGILEWVYCALIAIILSLFIKHFIGTPTVVEQESMKSTLIPGDRLVLSRIARTFKKLPDREEIITFEAPSKLYYDVGEVDQSNPVAKYDDYSNNFINNFTHNFLEFNKKSYIKRVIGIPGDHIQIKDNKVYRNGEELQENYLDKGTTTEQTGQFSDITVPDNTVFAMGDNRGVSMDCRVFGCIPIEKIESKVVIRFWPLNKFGKVE